MCKYCKNLKRIKDLEEKEYKKIIDKWRFRDKEARDLLFNCVRLFHAFPVPYNVYEVHERNILSFLDKNFLGK